MGTVRLQNAWTSGDDTVGSIFYNYRSSLFAETCAEKQDVRAGQDYADIVLKCYKNAPFALLDIYVADNNGALEDGDNAEVPNCCHPDLPAETPSSDTRSSSSAILYADDPKPATTSVHL